MSHIRRIRRSEWSRFFDLTTPLLIGKRADVEIDSMDLGSQVVAHLLPLLGLVYDARDDVLQIALEGLEHNVHGPRDIYVDDLPLGTTTLAVTDRDGVMRILTFSDPLMLPEWGRHDD